MKLTGFSRRLIAAAALAIAALAGAPAAEAAQSAVAAPIRVVHVVWGHIGYRAVGRGRPLVLITGSPDSIDYWPPSFIDALAVHHRVLALDNEGVGRTTLRPGTLTIPGWPTTRRRSSQGCTCADPMFLDGRWARFHCPSTRRSPPRGAVRRLVLCATGPGDGRFVFGGALPPGWIGPLFPPDQTRARTAFYHQIHSYPAYYGVAPAVQALQGIAIARWVRGIELAGREINRIRAPALIGHGAEDPFDPPSNSRILAATIPHPNLHIYPDAAHGFLFQDAVDWIGLVERFLR